MDNTNRGHNTNTVATINLDIINQEMENVFKICGITSEDIMNKVNELIDIANKAKDTEFKFMKVTSVKDISFSVLKGNATGKLYQQLLKKLDYCVDVVWGKNSIWNIDLSHYAALAKAELWMINTTDLQRQETEKQYNEHIANKLNINMKIDNTNNNNNEDDDGDIDLVHDNNMVEPPKKKLKTDTTTPNDNQNNTSTKSQTHIPNNNPNELEID